MDEKKAREMIDKIGEWLSQGAPGAKKEDPYESVHADLARSFASSLLEDARVEDCCGCPLCQG